MQIVDVPPDAEVFMNGASKGKGPQQFNQLAPGTYELIVRRQAYRPYRNTLNLAPGKAETVSPKFEYPRLAIFPMRRTGTWASADNEEFTAGWVTTAIKNAAVQAGLAITHTVHTENPRSINTTGEDLRKDGEIISGSWSFFGNADVDLAARKGKQLDVDAVILVYMSTGAGNNTGNWKAYLVDARNGKSVDASGTWPYGNGAGPAMTKNLEPLLSKYVEAYR